MDEYLQSAKAYAQAEPLIAGGVALVLLYLLLRQTKLLLFLVLLAALVGGALWFVLDLAGKGGATKSRMVNQPGVQDVK